MKSTNEMVLETLSPEEMASVTGGGRWKWSNGRWVWIPSGGSGKGVNHSGRGSTANRTRK